MCSFISHKAESSSRFLRGHDKNVGFHGSGLPTSGTQLVSGCLGSEQGNTLADISLLLPPVSQLTAKLTDKVHQCVSLVGASTNNVAMLAMGISKWVRVPSPYPAELDQIRTAAGTITNVCAVLATCSAWISCWATILQRQMWLILTPALTGDIKRELLQGPVSEKGLFGPHFQSVLNQLQSSFVVLQQVHRHTTLAQADSCFAWTLAHWQNRRDSRP